MSSEQSDTPRPADFRIVDLFAGPGGLDIAAHALGVRSTGIEWDTGAIATRSRAGLSTVPKDVLECGPEQFPEANVLAGGPPCQTFTVAGHGAGRKALDTVLQFVQRLVDRDKWANIETDLAELDPRTRLVLQPLRWALKAIDELEPYEAIVLEQVPAVLPVWDAYARALRNEGYETDHGVLHTEEFGVPQTRRRAVLVARRGSRRVRLPEATHHRYRRGEQSSHDDLTLGESLVEPWVTMEQALPHRRGPFTVISNYGTGGIAENRGRRHSHQPSATVTGKVSRNRVVAPDGTDLPRFTFAEAGLLQTFPAAYPWSGTDVSQQIGNAVPPRLGMHIISAALGLGRPTDAALERLASWTPPVEDTDSVK